MCIDCYSYSLSSLIFFFFFFSSRRRHTRFDCDWSSDVCSSDLEYHSSSVSGSRYYHFVVSWYNPIVEEKKLPEQDRKSTRLNSSHSQISYAVFCLKKKKNTAILQVLSTSPVSHRSSPERPFPDL